jgi:hypothetical protein
MMIIEVCEHKAERKDAQRSGGGLHHSLTLLSSALGRQTKPIQTPCLQSMSAKKRAREADCATVDPAILARGAVWVGVPRGEVE